MQQNLIACPKIALCVRPIEVSENVLSENLKSVIVNDHGEYFDNFWHTNRYQ